MPVAAPPFWSSGQPPVSTLRRTPEPTRDVPDAGDLVDLLPDGSNPRPVTRPVLRPVRATTVDPPPAVSKGAIAGIGVGIGALCAGICGIAKKRSDDSSESTES